MYHIQYEPQALEESTPTVRPVTRTSSRWNFPAEQRYAASRSWVGKQLSRVFDITASLEICEMSSVPLDFMFSIPSTDIMRSTSVLILKS